MATFHPITPLGQFIASFVMIMGYGIIAVPTGIVTAEIAKNSLIRAERKISEFVKVVHLKNILLRLNFVQNAVMNYNQKLFPAFHYKFLRFCTIFL
jgi:hypothetical protein